MSSASPGLPAGRLLAPVNQYFTDNGRRARYGAAYMRSLCAHAGVGFTETSTDEDVMAVDGAIEFARMPVRVQIKCTSTFRVAGSRLSLRLEPGWVAKWAQSYTPVFVVVVKVPKSVPDWLQYDTGFTRHNTVSYGRRFQAATDDPSMSFDAGHRLTTETLYEWRDLAYDIADGVVS